MDNNKDKLLALETELSQRLTKIDEDLHSRVANAKPSEKNLERQNDDVLLNLKNEAQYELELIANALKKIENDEYGTCEKCQNEISEARLDAIPYATMCKECAT